MATKPTSRQLSYLKSLANRAGQTFTYPHTAAQASAQINRLKNTRPSTRTERRVEYKLIADQIQAGPSDSARVRDDEISGRGSTATWVQNRGSRHRCRSSGIGNRRLSGSFVVWGGTRPPSSRGKLLAVKGQAACKEDDDARQRGILASATPGWDLGARGAVQR